jgi:hypothetical protein
VFHAFHTLYETPAIGHVFDQSVSEVEGVFRELFSTHPVEHHDLSEVVLLQFLELVQVWIVPVDRGLVIEVILQPFL